MNKVPLIALSILAATALPIAGADAKPYRIAFFKIRVTATQNITWKQDLTDRSCQGVFRLEGDGHSDLRLYSDGSQPTAVEGEAGRVRFLFPGSRPGLAALGSLEREAKPKVTTVVAPPPGVCPQPLSIPSDCGRRSYPAGARLSVLWDSPKDWPRSYGIGPRVPSLHLGGPYVPNESQTMGFQNCLGEAGDDQLGANAYPAPGRNSGFGALPLSTLFGKRKSFDVTGRFHEINNHYLPPSVTGTWQAETTVVWTVHFKRLARWPGSEPPIDLGPLS